MAQSKVYVSGQVKSQPHSAIVSDNSRTDVLPSQVFGLDSLLLPIAGGIVLIKVLEQLNRFVELVKSK